MTKRIFGVTGDEREIYLYTLENRNGMRAEVMNFGAILANLWVPDRNGKLEDVVLGYDKLEDYYENGCFFGATVGPLANRTANASFTIDGVTYQLDKNDNQNNLHSHRELGFHKKVWDVEEKENSILFTLEVKDGEIGFPGNRSVSVTYTLTDENELQIHYEATSDKNTIFNMTNHSYFNLAGHQSGNIEKQRIQLFASHYTPIEEDLIPTGEIASVEGTPLDLTKEQEVGKEINADFSQLKIAGGYDHNFVVDNFDGSLKKIACLKDTASGRVMETYTDLPGVQVYSGNFIEKHAGKAGATYDFRSGVCFETQNFPNSANQGNFPDIVYGPNRKYETTTVYRFFTE